jgi:hypothetical protein
MIASMNAMRTVALKVDELQRSLAFISISTDGDVLLWTLAKCELVPECLIHLQPPPQHRQCAAAAGAAAGAVPAASSAVAAADELLPQQQIDGGLCMDFKKVCQCLPQALSTSWHDERCWHAACLINKSRGVCEGVDRA